MLSLSHHHPPQPAIPLPPRLQVGMMLEEKHKSRTAAWELVVVKIVEGGPAHTSQKVQVCVAQLFAPSVSPPPCGLG